MPAEGRKLTKSELSEDRFIEWIMGVVDYVKARLQLFVGGFVVLAVLVLAVSFHLHSQREARKVAAALLGEGQIKEASGQLDAAMETWRRLVDQYAGTPAAAQGTLLLANRYFARGRYDEARSLYEGYLEEYGEGALLGYAAWSGLATCLEAQGHYEQAADKFRQYAESHSGKTQAGMALLDAARCYGLAGDGTRQKNLLERVLKEFPHSPMAARARRTIELL